MPIHASANPRECHASCPSQAFVRGEPKGLSKELQNGLQLIRVSDVRAPEATRESQDFNQFYFRSAMSKVCVPEVWAGKRLTAWLGKVFDELNGVHLRRLRGVCPVAAGTVHVTRCWVDGGGALF